MANIINELYRSSNSQENLITRLDKAIEEKTPDRPFMDKIWREISGIFNFTIERTIPYDEKPVGSLQTEELKKIERRNYIHYVELKDIKRLRRLINFSRIQVNNNIDVKHIVEYNIFISKINSKYDTKICHLNTKWDSSWTENTITWFKSLNHYIKNRINNENQTQIKHAINKRCSSIGTNQKHFINSLLNREHKSIVLNRI